MNSSVCHCLQSCFESSYIQPRVLTHRLAPQKATSHQNREHEEGFQGEEKWSFFDSLKHTPHYKKQGSETEQEDYVYVHRIVNRSCSRLSTMSLEMCTESLGSETGSDISEGTDEFASLVNEKQSRHGLKRLKPRELAKKVNHSVDFPPPLTSLSSSDGVQLRPYREDGRLVVKAVAVSPCNPCFLAERADGRLKLSFFKDINPNFDNEIAEKEENDYNYDAHEPNFDNEIAEKEENAYNYDEDCVSEVDNGGEGDANGDNGAKVGCEIEVGDFARPSRCKEGGNGGKGMSNWGTFCMAIS